MVHTPEHTEFRFYLAGSFERMIACAIDHVIIVLTMFVIVLGSGFVGAIGGEGFFSFLISSSILIGVFMAWTYFMLFEGLWHGRTPGKAFLKLRVVSAEGTPVHMKQAVVRNLLRVVDMMPSVGGIGSFSIFPFYALGFASVFLSRRNQRLGDLAANTLVVKERFARQHDIAAAADLDAAKVSSLPKGLALSRQQAAALVAYVQRRTTFGDMRQEELAKPLASAIRKRFAIEGIASHDELLCLVHARLFGKQR